MSNESRCFAFVCAFLFLGALTAGADTPVTCNQTDEILTELRQLRALIEKQTNTQARPLPAPTRAATSINVGAAPFLGEKDAPLTIVEFTDFQCPYCNQFFGSTFPDLKKNYIDSGKVRFYSMDLPLDMHPNALRAAQAGRCAGEQGQFWPMHDRMQGNPARLEFANLVGYAEESGINVETFRQCVESEKYKSAVQQEAREATSKGARGTPAFVIGRSTPTGVEGELMVGTQPYSTFDEKLKAIALSK